MGLRNLGDYIGKHEISDILAKFNANYLQSEFTADGIAAEFYADLNGPSGAVSSDQFLKWVFTETRGAAIIEKFENMFTQCEVLEHFNSSYKIKVSRDNFSIGYLFGMMEDVKA